VNLACRQRAGEINTRPSNPTQRCRPMQRSPPAVSLAIPATKPTGGQSFSGRRAVAAPRGESQRHTARSPRWVKPPDRPVVIRENVHHVPAVPFGDSREFAAVARREIDMVVAWSVDRLGRSLKNLIEVLSDLHAKGVDLYLHQQGLDTSTPSGRAMFQMMGVFAEFERAIIRERVLSGISVTPSALALGDPRSASANYEITETSVNGGRCYRC